MRGALPARQTADARQPATGRRGTVLVPPAYLDDDARRVFEQAAASIALIGNVLLPADAVALGMYATAVVIAERGLREMASRTDLDSIGYKRLQVATYGAVDRAVRIGAEYGLQPAPRTRLGVANLTGQTLLQKLNIRNDEQENPAP